MPISLISSGVIYLLVFSSSIGLFAIVEKLYNPDNPRKNRGAQRLLIAIAILLPCLLAGFRGNNVGVDVNVYVVKNMNLAAWSQTFSDVCRVINAGTEYLYALLVFITSRFTTDAGLLLFFLQFFTILPITIAALQMRDKLSLSMAMAVYFFMYYNNSLNMMRQSVSCAFLILGTVYLLKQEGKSNVKIILSFLAAILFHKGGFIGVVCILFLYKVWQSNIRRIVKIFSIILIILFPYFMIDVFEWLVSQGILTGNFLVYGDIFLYGTTEYDYFVNPFSGSIMTNVLLAIVMVLLPNLYVMKNSIKKEHDFSFLQTTVIIGLLLYLVILFSLNTVYGGRLSLFFDMFIILLIPYAIKKPNVKLKRYFAYACLFFYWAIWIMLLGWSGSSFYTLRF